MTDGVSKRWDEGKRDYFGSEMVLKGPIGEVFRSQNRSVGVQNGCG